MPTIAVIDGGITIAMYYNDHDPPHFHAMQGEHEIRVEVDSRAIFAGDSAPAAMERAVLDWAFHHPAALWVHWAHAHQGRALRWI
jgi:phosphomannomutase